MEHCKVVIKEDFKWLRSSANYEAYPRNRDKKYAIFTWSFARAQTPFKENELSRRKSLGVFLLRNHVSCKARHHMKDKGIWRMKINDTSKLFEDNTRLGKLISSYKAIQEGRMLEKDKKLRKSHLGRYYMHPRHGSVCP